MSNNYFRLRIHEVPSSKEEEISFYCFEYGATGVSEALNFLQPDLCFDPSIVKSKSHTLDAFFTNKPSLDLLEKLKEKSPTLHWEITEEETKDWLAEWKKSFVPFSLIGPYWIVPSWHDSPTSDEKTIRIDPGMAFGTGTHATTKMAAYFVYKICQEIKKNLNSNSSSTLNSHSTSNSNSTSTSNLNSPLASANGSIQNFNMIDVGTGTAILSILAAKEGLGKIVGVEIDSEARRVARENVQLNKLLQIEILDKAVEEIHETYDIVVANIIDGVLIQIKKPLINLLKKGGQLFLTGILVEHEEEFQARFIENSGLKIVRRLENDEWVGYWLQA